MAADAEDLKAIEDLEKELKGRGAENETRKIQPQMTQMNADVLNLDLRQSASSAVKHSRRGRTDKALKEILEKIGV